MRQTNRESHAVQPHESFAKLHCKRVLDTVRRKHELRRPRPAPPSNRIPKKHEELRGRAYLDDVRAVCVKLKIEEDRSSGLAPGVPPCVNLKICCRRGKGPGSNRHLHVHLGCQRFLRGPFSWGRPEIYPDRNRVRVRGVGPLPREFAGLLDLSGAGFAFHQGGRFEIGSNTGKSNRRLDINHPDLLAAEQLEHFQYYCNYQPEASLDAAVISRPTTDSQYYETALEFSHSILESDRKINGRDCVLSKLE